MKLWLGRHGEAVDADASGSDFNRVLSPYGRQQVSQLARWLMTREPAPELVLHSPLVRARQTAETIAGEIPGGAVVLEESLLSPGFSTASLLHRLKESGVDRVVCIGHQPDIGRSLAEMTGGVRALISPGTLAGIEFHSALTSGIGSLRWLADPSWFGS
ncbi:MAG: histidine phosphatase family protein [Planctomycetes bacterium]|nr:histidine phosphatase family protein [Planctomycetota bacterium]